MSILYIVLFLWGLYEVEVDDKNALLS